jgi:hypothetical protein
VGPSLILALRLAGSTVDGERPPRPRLLIQLANVHVYDSFQDLGSEPPDYVTSQAMLDAGDEDAAAGHEGFDKQMAALKAFLSQRRQRALRRGHRDQERAEPLGHAARARGTARAILTTRLH